MNLKTNELYKKTRRLLLRPIQKQDYKAWLEASTNKLPAQNKWDSGPEKLCDCTKQQFQKLVTSLNQLARKDEYYRFYIFEKKSGAIVGEIDFNIFIRSTHQFANFGYLLYNPYWGRGYGREASLAGLKIGFQRLGLNRLEAAINLDNRKSISLAKAIGMRREGIKKRYWFENGQWTDHLIYVANPEDIGLKARNPFAELARP